MIGLPSSLRPRLAWLFALVAPGAIAAFNACSSFSEDTSGLNEGGIEGAPGSSAEAASGDGASTSAYRALVMSDAPLAYWRMGAKADRLINDETGRGNDLVLQGRDGTFGLGVPGAIQGDDDTAVHFDGVEGHARALNPRAFDFPSAPFTVELWARSVDVAAPLQVQHLVSHTEDIGGERTGFALFMTPAAVTGGPTPEVSFEFNPFDGGAQTSTAPPLAAGKWTHLAGVVTSDLMLTVYVDASAGETKAVKAPLGLVAATFFVASSRENKTFSGDLDEVAVYDKALTLKQIAAHVAAAHP